ncbi:hypothetical protein [Phytohabitans aurantiacus]|uniref:Uncharacterized protein n=1 Tax=Phytohabitans aurantiacus TaxID=3016789 RepID=A0ABQ5R8B9_9ACTN|nr:hypothetical protein [Phytohabitans aurantiacus]GLI02999.1 hypothetical protein Pa4123_82770 [Phytohabitans aurantiacus]
MAERYEFVDANADIVLYPPGTEIGVEPIAGYTVVIGDPWATALAVEGSLPQLAAFAERLLASVRRIEAATMPNTDGEATAASTFDRGGRFL